MKKYLYLALALVLTASVLAGCGCTNQKKTDMSSPTVLPTNEEAWGSTGATTPSGTGSTTPSTMNTMPSETVDRGNGPLEDSMIGSSSSGGNTESNANSGSTGGSSESTSATTENQSRSVMPKMR